MHPAFAAGIPTAVPARRLSSSDHRNKPEPSKRLLDNQSYVFDGSIVKNGRLPSGTVVFDEAPGRRTRPEHFENEIWHFLNSVSRDVEKTLNDNIADALILFNDEDYEHNTDGGFIGVTGTDARNFTLNTSNLIGFVKRGDYSLKISSGLVMLSFSTSLPMPTGFSSWKTLVAKVTPMDMSGSLHIFGISSSRGLTGWGFPKPTLQRMIGYPAFAEQSMRLTTSGTIPLVNIYAPIESTATTVPQPRFSSKPMRRLSITPSASVQGMSTIPFLPLIRV